MRRRATTVQAYLEGIPAGRRKDVETVRRLIRENLPPGYEETMDFGMISYVVPLRILPDTYNGHPLPLVSLAAQKRHNALYLMSVYSDSETRDWFLRAYGATGKRPDLGKACLRFRSADDLALDVVARLVARVPVDAYVDAYRRSRRVRSRGHCRT